jgi:Zn-finger nucleic acid-binding protein
MPETKRVEIASIKELIQTLWYCNRCSALIAIYSADVIELAICPICCDVTLDQRGSFEAILGMTFEERSPAAS